MNMRSRSSKRISKLLLSICISMLMLLIPCLVLGHGTENNIGRCIVLAAGSDQYAAQTKYNEQAAVREKVERLLSKMTLHEKVSQLFIVTPEKLTGYSRVIQAGDATRKALEITPVGGLIYSTPNLVSKDQVKTMITSVQSYSRDIVGVPMFISVDEEGGNVARCANTLGTASLSPMFQYRKAGAKTAKKNAKMIAKDISALGFNLDFAPVADTWSNPYNKVIGQRAYSDDFSECAVLVAAAVRGFHKGGILCTLKHFPGHGNTGEDSHTGGAYSDKTLEELRKEELLPFKRGIKAGADFVMTSHVTLRKVDDVPASLSYKITTELLRNELGFEGIIITDALVMRAVSNTYSSGDLAVKAFLAGNDMLLEPNDLKGAVSAIESAVKSGKITQERLDSSVRRILTVKISGG